MFKQYFQGINGIEIYPVILLIVFFLFFISMSVWLIRANNIVLGNKSRIPLDENEFQRDSIN